MPEWLHDYMAQEFVIKWLTFSLTFTEGIADEMHDAPLHDHLREDGFSAIFETRHTIHREEADLL